MNRRSIANSVGAVSIILAAAPLCYIARPEAFPNHALTESVVLIGGVGGSFLTALIAGFIGSRWWMLALVGAAVDAICRFGFSP